MARASKKKPIDDGVESVWEVLREYQTKHPKASIDVYRSNPVSIRIRIVDPDFRGLDRVDRDSLLWKTLDKLPEDVRADITLLLLFTPDETTVSFANYDFEHPTKSLL
jgi:hypothetical protein